MKKILVGAAAFWCIKGFHLGQAEIEIPEHTVKHRF